MKAPETKPEMFSDVCEKFI